MKWVNVQSLILTVAVTVTAESVNTLERVKTDTAEPVKSSIHSNTLDTVPAEAVKQTCSLSTGDKTLEDHCNPRTNSVETIEILSNEIFEPGKTVNRTSQSEKLHDSSNINLEIEAETLETPSTPATTRTHLPVLVEIPEPHIVTEEETKILEVSKYVTTESADSSGPPYRVLILAPCASRSLYNLCRSLSLALGDAGHNITFVSSFPPSVRHDNVREVSSGTDNSHAESYNYFDTSDDAWKIYSLIIEVAKRTGQMFWTTTEIKQLWQKRNSYDAIIIIGYYNEIASPFLIGYNGTYINFCTPGVEFLQMSYQGNWLPLSVVPSIYQPYDHEMTFLERAINLPSELLSYLLYVHIMLPSIQSLLDGFFPGMPPVPDLYWNSSVTLINGHYSLDGPVPLLPTQVEIGTINAKAPQSLPQDLEEFMTGAGEAGVILFSLGSVVKSTDILTEYKEALVEAFRRVPQRVVWKYEGNDLHLPPNVITRKWIPQQDILGHNQTRFFMSHCGNLGMQEAMYHGVPVLALPVAFDQPRNAARMARKGYAVVLNWRDLSVDTLLEAITTLTSDPQYHSRMSGVSRAVKDQAESPGQRAVWWVEYAVRHVGSPHLLYAGKKLHLLQYIMIDVILFWLIIISLPLYITFFCLRMLIRSLSRKITNQDKDAMHKKND